jgi:hypothetical protein
MANTSFFISFSRKTPTVRPPLKRIDKKKSTAVVGFEQRTVRLYSPAEYLAEKLFDPQICSPFRDGRKRNNPHDYRYLMNKAPDSEMAFASQPGA